MKLRVLIAAPAVALLVTALAKAGGSLPEGWIQAGNAKSCRADVVAVSGGPTPRVFSLGCEAGARDFSTAMQQIQAGDYAGKRVRLSASVQGEGLAQWGGIWMRADTSARNGAAFDNMQDRPLKGSFGWQEAQVVLDIPADTSLLSFGFVLSGAGELRATQFKLEVVPSTVAVTAQAAQRLLAQPLHMSPP